MTWTERLFPYRAHLEQEVEYLRAQLAQKQRRVDELEEALVEQGKRPPVRPRPEVDTAAREKVQKMTRPRGWDEFRVHRRLNPVPVETEEGVTSGA